ncbi:MAG: branched-chain amino acid ABC transporter permease [Hydrogenophilales bacterium]
MDNFIIFLIQLFNSFQTGMLLFFVALGLTLIFGIVGIINLAHGSFFMMGAYLSFFFYEYTQNIFFTIIISLITFLLIGILLEKFIFRKLQNYSHLNQVLFTFGLILIFDQTRSLLFGNDVFSFDLPEYLSGSINLWTYIEYPIYRIILTTISVFLLLLIYFFLKRTKYGLMLRASSDDIQSAKIIGIDTKKLFKFIFIFGFIMTATVGMLSAPITSIYPNMDSSILLNSFIVVIVGGIGSILGVFVASMIFGIIDNFSKIIEFSFFGYEILPAFSSILIYFVMLTVLIFRPNGIFNKQ